ncbi:peroxisome biogenesis protein 1 isoform X1 [Dendrobium catenatum]|uniref:Peroxisomal ATPase PEX1 n=2 Tax=Dendrobium catenatum TaxID=906689 RepID=A0A2I0VJU6_9ASPA|nr:peroxisome biogenesis protein 1 isoform X1 [Dendrobium catenatum]PKU63684.1 Peroxisome biogenesis protein 1 [Dendrobium catenatum]
MELEVKVVGGIESCFVSLPLSLIHTLQSTSGGFLPPVLAIELRSYSGASWSVAWSGSASKSSSIEVGQQVAECISLPNGTKVQVKANGNLSKASLVNIEPNSEDDWEILELNSQAAEEAILKQVGIVFEGMKFPLWLHGHMVVEFIVVSIFPNKPVVQLMPGTEVAVRPKSRKNRVGACTEVQSHCSIDEKKGTKAILRIQASEGNHVHKLVFGGVEFGVVLTSVVHLHPETARKLSFDNLQLVVIEPRLPHLKAMKNLKDATQRGSNFANSEGNTRDSSNSTRRARHTILRILYSDTVAKGHMMLPKAIRLFLRAAIHSWVWIKKYNYNPMKDVPFLTLSPCRFQLFGKNNSIDKDDLNVFESRQKFKRNSTDTRPSSLMNMNVADLGKHENFLESLFDKVCVNGDKKGVSRLDTKWDQKFLIQAWFIGQLKELALHSSQMELTSITLPKETILHFEITNYDLVPKSMKMLFSEGHLEKQSEQCTFELLYLLVATFDESCHDELKQSYELTLNAGNKDVHSINDLGLISEKLEFGDPLHLDSVLEGGFGRKFNLTLSSLSWMEKAATDAINRLLVLLSPSSLKLLNTFNVPLPGHVLIYGPPGSGKSTLVMAIAKHLEEHAEILAHVVFIGCSKLALEKSQTIRQAIADYVSEALVHSPSIIVFDDLDNIISFSSDSEGLQTSTSVTGLANFLIDIMDEYRENCQNSCGYGSIAFVASAQSLGKLPHLLTSSGRFDFHVELPAPAVSERGAILKHEILKRGLHCSEDIISEIASKCDGFDAYDLEILVDRAVHAAISHSLAFNDTEPEKPVLIKDDFSEALHDFVPVSMRGLTKAVVEGGRNGWEDIGGLSHIRTAIQEMIELPSKFPNIFAHSPLRMRSNVLLYGPPGCGKTHIIGAAAVACSLRFISVKGPELLNKYIGASEQAVRDLFSKAAAAAPCLLFFDEFDSIAPKRGHDNTGVTDRVVNQLLTELDGVEALTGVFVFAATSRPDLLDAALLRPGRLDRLLFCDFPSWHERLDILKVLSRKLPLSADVNLEVIASMTEGFSGADLQALLSDAQLASVHELLDREATGKWERIPIINDMLLKSVASKTRPSVSETEKRRLYAIYSQFLDSKKSVASQIRDAKGKRATLA